MYKKLVIACGLSLLSTMLFAQEKVRIVTNQGDIIVQLYANTPIHRKNFLRLANEGFYDSTLFHRVIREFMIQGGDPQSKPSLGNRSLGSGGPGYTLEAELDKGHIHKKGALAAARQGDDINPQKRSSGSQFYIVVGRQYPRKYLGSFEEQSGISYTEEEKEIYETQGGTPHLDGGYTVFGEVVKGLEIVETISEVNTARGDRPIEDVLILKMEVLK